MMFKYLSILFLITIGFASNIHAIELSSKSFNNNEYLTNKHVYNSFGCNGKNISPELQWKNAPKETKSFAITAYDPDAPTGSGWWHWLVFNIPTDINNLKEGIKIDELPKSVILSRTDFGKIGYGGPCPPKGHGKHRYIFTVFALDVEALPLDKNVTAATVGFYLNNHVIEKDSIVGYYKR
ncbi:MAG: YbhB/YbcL family Raf kinase inhibitor-like protein [Rickettsiales bacterium]|nr:YbhB/YbcL family Raf kinase inhibitor-like protein [Rickettsiales bacterium]